MKAKLSPTIKANRSQLLKRRKVAGQRRNNNAPGAQKRANPGKISQAQRSVFMVSALK